MTRLPIEAQELILYTAMFIWVAVAVDLMIHPPDKDDK